MSGGEEIRPKKPESEGERISRLAQGILKEFLHDPTSYDLENLARSHAQELQQSPISGQERVALGARIVREIVLSKLPRLEEIIESRKFPDQFSAAAEVWREMGVTSSFFIQKYVHMLLEARRQKAESPHHETSPEIGRTPSGPTPAPQLMPLQKIKMHGKVQVIESGEPRHRKDIDD
jgi:hypothetical protein